MRLLRKMTSIPSLELWIISMSQTWKRSLKTKNLSNPNLDWPKSKTCWKILRLWRNNSKAFANVTMASSLSTSSKKTKSLYPWWKTFSYKLLIKVRAKYLNIKRRMSNREKRGKTLKPGWLSLSKSWRRRKWRTIISKRWERCSKSHLRHSVFRAGIAHPVGKLNLR